MATYSNTHTQYDCAIDGVPFFLGPSAEFPLVREGADVQRQQIDSTNEPGEQSLTSWWYRSQSSFHLGGGQRFYDPIRGDQNSQFRFYDSAGVDVWSQGQVSLLKTMTHIRDVANWGDMTGWSNDGDSGLLFEEGSDVRCWKVSTGSSTVVNYEDGGAGSGNVWGLDVSSERYFVISSKGIFVGPLPGAGGTKRYDIPSSATGGTIRWTKERLFATVDSKVYEISDLSPGAATVTNKALTSNVATLTTSSAHGFTAGDSVGVSGVDSTFNGTYTVKAVPSTTTFTYDKTASNVASTAASGTVTRGLATTYAGNGDTRLLFTHPEDEWRWNGIEPGPDCVFFSGYAGTSTEIHGHNSCIYASTIEVANIDDAPQLTQPAVVAEMPHGEYILSMTSYLGTYLVVTTTKGVRVCAIGQQGQLRVGPLSIAAADYAYHATVWDRFVYVTGATVDGYDGCWRLDLSAPIDQTGLRFAWAKDVATGRLSSAAGYPARIAIMGTTGRVAIFTAPGSGGSTGGTSGIWLESATDLVASGWIQTGEIRFDTWTNKNFAYLRSVFDRTTVGTVRPYWVSEAAAETALATATSVSGVPYLDTAASDGAGRMGVSFKWVLARATATTGPTFRGYQTRALPSGVKQRDMRLPLLCYRRERMRSGRTVERSTWDRITALEALEKSAAVVPYQNFLTGESVNVTVESVQFVQDSPGQSAAEMANPGGMLTVTLRTADT